MISATALRSVEYTQRVVAPAALPRAVPRRRLVVIGNGMAGGRVLEELMQHAPELYDITVFGDVADSSWYLDLMRDRIDISYLRDGLMFGRAVADSLPIGLGH